MKLTDIYDTRLDETLDNPLPFIKVTKTRYEIPLSDTEKLFVLLHGDVVDGYKCISVLFVNPNSVNPTAVTNFFNGPSAIRIFSTVVAILDPIQYDLVVFIPDDITVEVEKRKTKLYGLILKKLERLGKISYSQIINVDNFDKPVLVGVRKVMLDDNMLKKIVTDFGVSKFSH